MKIIIAFGLVCLVGLSMSYPADRDQQLPARRNTLRRRNGPVQEQVPQYRNRRPEQQQKPRFVPAVVEAPARFQKKADRPLVAATKRRSQYQEAPVEVRDNSVAASDVYAGGRGYDSDGYETDRLKFEQSVQDSANSYNSDHGITDGRLNFAISGQQGPHSYRFGYDTGKGADRTFRFEEKDAEGVIHGRYGYYDPTGKFRIVNYSAHPKHGFQAEGNYAPK